MPFLNTFVLLFGLLLLSRGAIAPPTGEALSKDTCDWSKVLMLSPAEASLHDKRTVWSIVWSCLATIFACCWVAVHPNMLEKEATPWQSIVHRIKHMIWMIMFPEVIVSWALRQRVGAQLLMEQAPFKNAGPKWTVTHAHFLQMGGFVLEGTTEILSAERLKDLLDSNKVALPNISKKDIQDRSKSDAFSKTIALGQTTWFLAQCLTRRIQGLATTEMELVTVAFATLNLWVFASWLDKPQSVQTTVMVPFLSTARDETGQLYTSTHSIHDFNTEYPNVKASTIESQYPSDQELSKIDARSCSLVRIIVTTLIVVRELFDKVGDAIKELFYQVGGETRFMEPGKQRIATFYTFGFGAPGRPEFTFLFQLGSYGMIFGAIHCAGWHDPFPSHAEMIIWRVSCIITTVVPVTWAFFSEIEVMIRNYTIVGLLAYEVNQEIVISFGVIGLISYIVARILLLVEALISLRDLSPGALLAVRWTSFLPHL